MRNKAHKLVLNYSLGSRTINNTVERTENKYIIKQTKYEKLTKKKNEKEERDWNLLNATQTEPGEHCWMSFYMAQHTKRPRDRYNSSFSVYKPHNELPSLPPVFLTLPALSWRCENVRLLSSLSVGSLCGTRCDETCSRTRTWRWGWEQGELGAEPLSCNCHEARLIMAA